MEQQLTKQMEFIVQKDMVNFYGFLHGGELFKNMDTVAGLCSKNYCHFPTLTKAVNDFVFHHPSFIGDHIIIFARIVYVGRTSMEVYVKAYNDTQKKEGAKGYFTMVAIDVNKKAIPVPPMEITTKEQRAYYELGKKRREIYQQIEELHK